MVLHQLITQSSSNQEDYRSSSLRWPITDSKKILLLLDRCINIFSPINTWLMSKNTVARLNTTMKAWIWIVHQEHLILGKATWDIKMLSIIVWMNNNLNSKINKGICFSIETKVSHKFLIPTQKMNYLPIKSKSNLNFLANMKKNH